MEETKKLRINKEMIKKRILPTLIISFLMPFVIFISVPFEMYANNLDEFLFTVSDFLPMLCLFTFVITALIFLLLLFLPQKIYRVLCAVIIACAFLFFIQGNFLNGSSYSLAGDNLESSSPSTAMSIFNLVLWLIVIAGAIILSLLKDKHGIISSVSFILIAIVFAVQVVIPTSCVISNNQVFMSINDRLQIADEKKNHEILTKEHLTTVSTTNNVYYFCIDRFDETYAEKAIEKYPEIYSNLTGFTWFQDNTSIYAHTYPAVANMLTKNDLDIEKYRSEYLNETYNVEGNPLSVLSENGYDINIHTQNYYAFTDASYLPDYVYNSETVEKFELKNPFLLAWNMVKLSCFRISPLILKFIYMDVSSNSCNAYINEIDANGNQKYSLDMKEVYDYVSNTAFNTTTNKQFNFIHLEGCHSVMYDENWNNISLSLNKDISVAVKSSFMIIDKFIQTMKDLGVYDNATIIITGDHGAPDNKKLSNSTLTALFVKPANSTNENLKISNAQTSHDNIWATIIKSENISTSYDYGTSVFEISEDVNQKRRFVLHTYFGNLSEYTYEINGAGKDFSNWKMIDYKHIEGRSIMD